MLKGDLYTVESLSREGQSCSAVLALNPDCRIYKAHFPGRPITPGVCIVQMCVEMASEVVGRSMELCESKDIRFLVPLIPGGEDPVKIDFSLPEGDRMQVEFVISAGETVHAKMKLTLE